MSKIRVAVVFGGRSGEHEVSCASARNVVAAIDQDKYEVILIGIGRDGRFMLPAASRAVLDGGPLELGGGGLEVEGEPVSFLQDPSRHEVVLGSDSRGEAVDVVFPVLHGPNGEDGSIQGLLEIADIPYVGSAVLGSALAMDKEKMKVMFASVGLPVADYVIVRAHEWAIDADRLLDEAAWLGFPSFSKPANLGSSVGISRCTDLDSLRAGIEEALRHDRKVLVEEAVPGRELECGVLGNEVPESSVVGEVIAAREFYDYEAKYIDSASTTVIPAEIPAPVEEIVRKYAIRAFTAVEGAGMARVDFFYQNPGRGVVVNEINTIPGFTRISMYPKLWEATGVPYTELIERLIQLAIDRHRSKPRPESMPPPAGLPAGGG
ncbi:MAG TPA: D-alanine--D-alanine ligase family protein [Actinomycetota bacterium]|nr:D-alanine--D-alanine ligase family protein [Actinomycetota bacterium]